MSSRFLLLSLLCLTSLAAYGQANTTLEAKNYEVYNAVFAGMRLPVKPGRVLIADTTLNTGCGDASGNPVRMNDCGMFFPPATEQGIYDEARKAWPALSAQAWTDLLKKSRRSVTLIDAISTSFEHRVSNLQGEPEMAWKKPDALICLSQVGFSAEQKQAVVYIQIFSYMAGVPTGGDLFLLNRDTKGQWQVTGRLTLIKMGG